MLTGRSARTSDLRTTDYGPRTTDFGLRTTDYEFLIEQLA